MADTYWFIYTAPNVTVQSNTPGHPFTVSGAGCGASGPFTTPFDFFWTGGTACRLSFTSPDTSTPGARYTFQGWEDGVATNPRTVIASATPATYTAYFTAEYQLTVQASNGTVTANPTSADGYYSSGSVVQLTAAPAFGYQFSGWSGDLSGTTSPQSVTMNGPHSVTASFTALPTYTISGLVTAPAGGPLSGVGVALSGSPFSPTVTDLSGHYVFAAVPSGGPYTVTPSLAGYIFVPRNQTFSNLSGSQTANFASSYSAVLSIAKAHTGNFTQGQNGATYTVTVSNAAGAGPTNSTVTVSETVPAGLTLVSMSGGPTWNCTVLPACTTSSVLNGGLSYAAITVTVNVAASAASPLTNQVSVSGGGSATASASDPTTINMGANPLQFVPVAPCRVMDTRNATGPVGGPYIAAGTARTVPIPSSPCGVPANAVAYSLNVTVVPRTGWLGFLTVWPTGQPQPLVSTLNSMDGSILANAAIVPAGTGGSINAYATNDTELIIDINGYFVPPATGTLQFYPLTPCRVLDTRNPSGTFGGPAISGLTSRSFPIPSSGCGAPSSAAAYSLNVTVVPHGMLGYVTAWPTGQSRVDVSILNSLDGTVLADAAIVPAGTGGAVSFYASNTTDLVVDINGYFAPPGSGGLNFYTVTPCRIVDTRNANGTFGGPILSGDASRAFPLSSGSCGVAANSAAYSLNMTVVPSGWLGYLTTWPTGQSQPLVSTLNALKGQIVANAALVPAGTSGSINVYVMNTTQLIIDTNGYFGQ
jgi:uncharacterized repeat protein (TIGR01451 family)